MRRTPDRSPLALFFISLISPLRIHRNRLTGFRNHQHHRFKTVHKSNQTQQRNTSPCNHGPRLQSQHRQASPTITLNDSIQHNNSITIPLLRNSRSGSTFRSANKLRNKRSRLEQRNRLPHQAQRCRFAAERLFHQRRLEAGSTGRVYWAPVDGELLCCGHPSASSCSMSKRVLSS